MWIRGVLVQGVFLQLDQSPGAAVKLLIPLQRNSGVRSLSSIKEHGRSPGPCALYLIRLQAIIRAAFRAPDLWRLTMPDAQSLVGRFHAPDMRQPTGLDAQHENAKREGRLGYKDRSQGGNALCHGG